jgi:hypothetical protein
VSLQSEVERYLQKNYIEKIEKKLMPIYNNAYGDFLDVVESKIRKIHETAIDEFYMSYRPMFYKERRGSLYDTLIFERKGNRLRGGFEPSVMKYRDGSGGRENDLYDIVFRKGYHGGAKNDKNGGHPNPGIPYWRTPYPKYNKWGKPAEIAEISPLERFKEKINEYQNNGEYQRDFDNTVGKKVNDAISKFWR